MEQVQHCQVLGPFNTGTVLMDCYVRALYKNFEPGRFDYWKHTLPPDYFPNGAPAPPHAEPPQGFEGVLFICMVRSPYFWLTSTCRRPYSLHFETRNMDLGRRLRSPIRLRGRPIKNVVALWNSYYRAYADRLAVKNRVVHVRLEDLVMSPRGVLARLDTLLERRPGLDTDAVIEKVSARPTKRDNAHGEVWEEKNSFEHLFRATRAEDLAFINQQVDQRLLAKFEYPMVWPAPAVG